MEKISIHTLTQRVTEKLLERFGVQSISIHTLTQRVTIASTLEIQTWIYFNPHPHAEGDQSSTTPVST